MKRAAQELDNALVQVMLVTGRQYFPDDDHQRLLHPQPSAEDGAHVEDLHRSLQAAVPMPVEPTGIDAALTLAFRLRVFMTALDAVTAWSVIQPHPGRRHEPAAAEGEGAGD